MTMRLYRTDDRDPYKIEAARGFYLKKANSIPAIKQFVQNLYKTGTISARIEEHHRSGKDWAIATDKGTFMGGYSKKFYYLMNFPTLKSVVANERSLGVVPGAIKEVQKPTLYLNAPSLRTASLIAVHVGPEKELTFLTPIPVSLITHYAQNKNGPWKRMKGRTEFTSSGGVGKSRFAALRKKFGN